MKSIRDRRHRPPFGLTIVESMMALAVLSVAVLAVNYAVVAGQTHARQGDHAVRGIDLAQDLMEEIVALPYLDPDGPSTPGPEVAETTRSSFDNTDDFHGYTEVAGGATDFSGTVYGGDDQVFGRNVTMAVSTEYVAGLGTTIPGLTVTVAVTDPTGRSWAITRFVPESMP